MRDTQGNGSQKKQRTTDIPSVMLPLGARYTPSSFYKQKTIKSLTTIALSTAKVNFKKVLHPETLTDTQLGATITVTMT